MQPTEQDLAKLKLQMLLAQGQPRRVPSFPGSVLHGATLGWAGTPPETIPDYVGAFLGGVIPATAVGLITEGLGVPTALGSALGLGRAAVPALRGALVGGVTGGLFGKESTPPERIANALSGAALGGVLDYGISKYKMGKLPQAPVKEKLPELPPKGLVEPHYQEMAKEITQPQPIKLGDITGKKIGVAAQESGFGLKEGAGETFTHTPGTVSVLGKGKAFDPEFGPTLGTKTPEQLELPFVAAKRINEKGQLSFKVPTAEQPPQPISVTHGTFEKIANRLPLDEGDIAALRATKSTFGQPPVYMGLPPSEPIQKLGGRQRANVVKGINNQQDFDKTLKEVTDAGYKYQVMSYEDGTRDVFYFDKWSRMEKDAARLWATYRLNPGKLSFDDYRYLGLTFGKSAPEIAQWATNNAVALGLDGATRTMLLQQLGFPQFHKSPIISSVSRLVHNSYIARNHDLRAIFEEVTPILSKLNVDERSLVPKIIQGEAPYQSAAQHVKDAVDIVRKWNKNIALSKGLAPNSNYITHVTDFDAYWAAFKDDIIGNTYKTAPKALQGKLTETEFDRLRDLMMKFTPKPGQEVWRMIPSADRGFIKDRLFRWDDVAKTMDELPEYARRLVPTDLFNPYMIPRKLNVKVPYVEDVVDIFNTYVNRMVHDIHFKPLLQDKLVEFQGNMLSIPEVINRLPGSGASGSERRYLERYIARVITGRPDSFASMLRNITDNVNSTLGVALGDANLLSDLITMYRAGVYRGALSIDSAIQNATQSINTAALNGRFSGPALKYLVSGRKQIPKISGVAEEWIDFTEGIPTSNKTKMGKAIALSDWMNKYLLYPMHVTENANRAVAWMAGMNEAAALGMDAKNALKLSLGKVIGIQNPLSLTEQQYHALLNTMKTQFGYDIAQQPPFASNPLWRLSSLFVSYPMRQAEFMTREIGSAVRGYFSALKTMGPKAAAETVDGAKLLRFLSLTGFMFGAPAVIGQMGLDVRGIWGKNVLPYSLPFYQTLLNTYNAVVGDEPMTKDQARDALMEAFGTVFVPQYRYLKKSSDVITNIERGFATNKKGQFVHESGMGELLRLLGVGPEEYAQKRMIAEKWYEVGREYAYEKRNSIEELVLRNNQEPVMKFMKKWGRPITPDDVSKFQQDLTKTPLQRATQNIPLDIIANVVQRKPYMAPGI